MNFKYFVSKVKFMNLKKILNIGFFVLKIYYSRELLVKICILYIE